MLEVRGKQRLENQMILKEQKIKFVLLQQLKGREVLKLEITNSTDR